MPRPVQRRCTALIYVTHGVVPKWDSKRISHGLMLSEAAFTRHLQERTNKYVPLMAALKGGGDALTVDDATYAGMQAALLARRHGHAVSWFVNGLHVDGRLPYFPFQLSWMLDVTEKVGCTFDRQYWNLSELTERRALRLHLKRLYLQMRSDDEIADLLKVFSCCLGVERSTFEPSLSTVTSTELTVAANAGVDLENHGWTHLNPQTLSERELAQDVALNESYLSRFRQTRDRVFAPAFGRSVTVSSGVARYLLLADRNYVSNKPNGSVFNRSDLHVPTLNSASFTNFRPMAEAV